MSRQLHTVPFRHRGIQSPPPPKRCNLLLNQTDVPFPNNPMARCHVTFLCTDRQAPLSASIVSPVLPLAHVGVLMPAPQPSPQRSTRQPLTAFLRTLHFAKPGALFWSSSIPPLHPLSLLKT
eukprot:GGOE01010374.1.p5 GENE.GGOE01010374.1~~GGOE01010374.1.p5  ORF type:complete len:122 (-),score=10.73 GGOE01010374.1:1189-1554(-)